MCSPRVSPSVALVLSKVLRVLARLLVRRNALAEPVTHANVSAAELSLWHVTMLDHLRPEGCFREVPAASASPGRRLTVWDDLQGQCSGRDSGQRPGSRAQVRCPLARCKCSSAPHSADAFARCSLAHTPACRSWAGHGMRRLQHVTSAQERRFRSQHSMLCFVRIGGHHSGQHGNTTCAQLHQQPTCTVHTYSAQFTDAKLGRGSIECWALVCGCSNIGVPAPTAPDPRLLAALLAGAAGGQHGQAPEGPSLAEVAPPPSRLQARVNSCMKHHRNMRPGPQRAPPIADARSLSCVLQRFPRTGFQPGPTAGMLMHLYHLCT